MTKKERVLKIFNEAVWLTDNSGKKWKSLTYNMFLSVDLCPTIEYGEKYCDVIYARNILNKMGYKVLIGSVFIVMEKI